MNREAYRIPLLADESALSLGERFPTTGTSPSNRVARCEIAERVRAALAEMLESDREVLVLRFVEQLSTSETAAELETTDAAVRKRQRALWLAWLAYLALLPRRENHEGTCSELGRRQRGRIRLSMNWWMNSPGDCNPVSASDVEEFTKEHPAQAERLLVILPAMQVLTGMGCATMRSDLGAHADGAATGTLGDFRIHREIGHGGMGVVYEAEQTRSGRRVALKVLPFAFHVLIPSSFSASRTRPKRRSGLHHTNIVPVFATGCERGVHYFAMQFIEGQTLAQLIAELRERESPARKLRAEGPAKIDGEKTPTGTTGSQAGIQPDRSPRFPRKNLAADCAFFHSIARLGIQKLPSAGLFPRVGSDPP